MEVSGQFLASVCLLPRQEAPVPIGEQDGWAPGSTWMRRRREKVAASVANLTPVFEPVA